MGWLVGGWVGEAGWSDWLDGWVGWVGWLVGCVGGGDCVGGRVGMDGVWVVEGELCEL